MTADSRVLTVRQPWADLIMAGVKDVENRTWPMPSTLPQWGRCTDCRLRLPEPMTAGSCPSCDNFRGRMVPDGLFPFRLWIHAGTVDDRNQRGWEEWCRLADLHTPEFEPLPDPDDWDDVRRGVLLGSVTVTGCHHADRCRERGPIYCGGCPDCLCSPWAEPDVWHWTLADPVPLDQPVPLKGRQGLWRLPEGVA